MAPVWMSPGLLANQGPVRAVVHNARSCLQPRTPNRCSTTGRMHAVGAPADVVSSRGREVTTLVKHN
ncbi:hypothetical protein GCM10023175_29000 [Pseudonocardia xishanensis]|uniref:Uncharacterized protein n=1 Tax=Pseudonocardia xishanensis TaxID=630995 RepID=A0ABP8RST4_9PSEU